MDGLFEDNQLFMQRESFDYVITGAAGVSRADWRITEGKQDVKHLLRSLLTRFATPGAEFGLVDGQGVHRLDIASAAGSTGKVDLTVSEPGGELVGSAATDGRKFTVFPTIVLSDGAGEPVGHMTTRRELRAYDVFSQETAVIAFGSSRPVFGRMVYEVSFTDNVPTRSRVLIVAALIGWDLSR
ncbi:hypothetical protein LWF01_06325 [Saxibacter everestensis]|uniref:Uncharacterized protein n=1 Tax=Saxibacter everestensis TaxID=2909229 RepID=A0ABY8QWL1_9MICO|nr:hypothetical protein LWF01_06325 [Brevibacteriaceae bacterium ZFBP1038]